MNPRLWALLPAVVVFLASCGGPKVLPQWAHRGMVAVDWPVLEGQVGDQTGREARAMATALRSHLLMEIPDVWNCQAVPYVREMEHDFLLESHVYQWEAFTALSRGPAGPNPQGDYIYGLTFVLKNPKGEILWQRSRTRRVPIRTKKKDGKR